MRRARITSQTWVTSVVDDAAPKADLSSAADTTNLQVRVTDEEAAEAQLLRLILEDPRTTVIEFGRQKQNLEAIFMEIIEGGTTHGNNS